MSHRNKALELSKCLFELEGESIFNDPDSHWLVHDWFDKYGKDSIKHKDFAYPEDDVQKLADILYHDYKTNFLDSLSYDPYVSDNYAGFITKVFERELASKTKIGTQLEILN